MRRAAPLVTVLAVTALFFAPTIFQGRVFLAADTLRSFYPWKAFAPPGFRPFNTLITDPVNGSWAANYNRLLKEGRVVDWNPYVGGGFPACNSGTMGVPGRFYPLKLLAHALLPTHLALSLLLVAHLFLMGWGMFLYLARTGAGRTGAVFGAVAYMLNGCAMVWFAFETVLPIGALLPLLLYFADRFTDPGRLRWAAAASVTFGLMVLMGHVQYLLYVVLLMILYCGFLLVRSARAGAGRVGAIRIVSCFALTGVLGLLIGAAELFPVLEAVSLSGRSGRSFTFQGLFETLGRVPWRWLVTLVFPDYFGSPPLGYDVIPRLRGQEYMNYNELCLYLGVPTLFGLLAAIVRVRAGAGRFHLAATAMLVAMMTGTWLYWPVFRFLPGMDRLNPTRIVFLFTFTAAAAAGFGVGALHRLTPVRRRVFAGSAAGLVVLVSMLAAASSAAGVVSWFQRDWLGRVGDAAAFVAFVSAARSLGGLLILKPLLLTLAAGALFTAFALLRGGRARRAVFAAILALLCYDLISFGWGYNPAVEPDAIYARTPAIEFLQRQPGVFRVVQDIGSGLYVNTLQPFQVTELGGYMNLYPKRINQLLSLVEYGPQAVAGTRFDRWVTFRNHASPLYDLLNVRFLLTNPLVEIRSPRYRLVYRNDLAIWENLSVMPRAFVVHRSVVRQDADDVLRYLASPAFDPRREVVLEAGAQAPTPAAGPAGVPAGSPARIDSYDYERVVVTAEAAGPGFLVLSDSFYPGWHATVDGIESPVLAADCNLRAVAIPRGRHTIVFGFRSAPARWGRRVSAASIVLVVAAFGFSLFRARLGRTAGTAGGVTGKR